MGLDCRFWHAAAAGLQHSKAYDYSVVTCGSVNVETGNVVFEYATRSVVSCVSIKGSVAFSVHWSHVVHHLEGLRILLT